MGINTELRRVVADFMERELQQEIQRAVVNYLDRNTTKVFVPAVEEAMDNLMERSGVMQLIVSRKIGELIEKELHARVNIHITDKAPRHDVLTHTIKKDLD
jgi:hypothetical protein